MTTSFKTKALAFVISLLVIVSAIYTAESIQTEKAIIRREILKRAETVTTLATKTGELPLLSGDPQLMKETLAFLRSSGELSAVAFCDPSGATLAQDGRPPEGARPAPGAALAVQMFEEPDAFVFFAPIFSVRANADVAILEGIEGPTQAREHLGWVRADFSKASMRQDERAIVRRGVLLSLVFTAASTLFVYLVISRVTRPLTVIAETARDIARGDLSRRVEGGGRDDEIGTLARAFGSMKTTIEEVLEETNGLLVAVRGGTLDTHGRAERFEGGWRELLLRVNQLVDAYGEAHRELELAKDAAESASRAKSEFLSSMSHELRTPLNAILGYAQILKGQENLTETQRRQLEILRGSGSHLLTLINDLLDVGKIEAGKMELDEAPFDLPDLLGQVYNISRIKADEKALSLEYEEVGSLPRRLFGDERKLKQVLLNLLANAVTYTREGRVTLRACYDSGSPGVLRVETVDTGRGIPGDKLEEVFEPFAQVTAEGQQREGTGLGLTITKKLVNLMRGRLGVASELGRGSTFWFEVPLPAAEGGDAQEAARPAVIGYRGNRRRVLVVDDNEANRSVLAALLEPLGFEVDTACGGAEALDRAAGQRPDLVLLDLVMPGVNGLDVVRRLKAEPASGGLKVIGVSAVSSESAHREAFAAACDDFVEKPIRLEQLLDRIRTHLGLAWETAPGEPSAPPPGGPGEGAEVPPPEELAELYELALLGDMRGIRSWAAELGAKEPRHRAFAERLRELAAGFKTKALVELVRRHREGP